MRGVWCVWVLCDQYNFHDFPLRTFFGETAQSECEQFAAEAEAIREKLSTTKYFPFWKISAKCVPIPSANPTPTSNDTILFLCGAGSSMGQVWLDSLLAFTESDQASSEAAMISYLLDQLLLEDRGSWLESLRMNSKFSGHFTVIQPRERTQSGLWKNCKWLFENSFLLLRLLVRAGRLKMHPFLFSSGFQRVTNLSLGPLSRKAAAGSTPTHFFTTTRKGRNSKSQISLVAKVSDDYYGFKLSLKRKTFSFVVTVKKKTTTRSQKKWKKWILFE